MKRSGFSNKGDWKGFKKPTKGLRRAKFGVIKPKVQSKGKKPTKPLHKRLKALKKQLWEYCKVITRQRHGSTCFTCGKTNLEGSSRQTGHFIPNSVGGALLRYNLNNLRIQCYYCNINLGGNGSSFYRRLLETEGQEHVDNLFTLKSQTIKADEMWYMEKIQEYDEIARKLIESNNPK